MIEKEYIKARCPHCTNHFSIKVDNFESFRSWHNCEAYDYKRVYLSFRPTQADYSFLAAKGKPAYFVPTRTSKELRI